MMGLVLNAGSFYDGMRFSPGILSELKIGSSLQLSLNYTHNFLRFSNRDQTFSGGVVSFKAQAMFSTKLSASTFVQYNSEANEIISNFRSGTIQKKETTFIWSLTKEEVLTGAWKYHVYRYSIIGQRC